MLRLWMHENSHSLIHQGDTGEMPLDYMEKLSITVLIDGLLQREKCFGYLVGYRRSKLRIVSACFSIHGGALTYSSSIDFC
ncbi:hypothetical protein PVAP13_4KG086700 [Panicum virgatum]|uniref:Uncharacterized protein n=1 Tax=Panicum virgatum TaxID=38727 RepID=A0A8T0TLI6_PANVG|nr:hypothetical protein PVAP13_4KG086700 [Panicum virgatum]